MAERQQQEGDAKVKQHLQADDKRKVPVGSDQLSEGEKNRVTRSLARGHKCMRVVVCPRGKYSVGSRQIDIRSVVTDIWL